MKKTVKTIFSLLLALLMLTLSVSAIDADIDYDGEIDPKTGKPVGEDSTGDEEGTEGDLDFTYNSKKGLYCYTVNGGEFYMDIPSGGVTTSDVKYKKDSGVSMRIYNNGTEITGSDGTLSDVGKYVILFDATGSDSVEFTIAGSETNLLYSFKAPDGFKITSATFNGEAISSTSYIDMTAEGEYLVTYECEQAGTSHSFAVTVDHTAPVLSLKQVKNGVARSAVDISDVPKGSTVSVWLEGQKISYEEELTKTGNYKIKVTDKAGNFTEYKFEIQFYFNFNTFIFFGILLVIAIGILIYMVFVKKRMRVR